MMKSPSKTVIVTGASQGIGARIVRAFLARGYNVVRGATGTTVRWSTTFLDQLVAGADIFDAGGPNRPLLDPLEKFTRKLEADISFEQNAADFPEAFLNRLFGQNAAARKLLERGVELAGQLFEHSL